MRNGIMGIALASCAALSCVEDAPVGSEAQAVGGETAIVVPEGQLRAVVSVNEGTGTLITPDTVLTAAHVVCRAPGDCFGTDRITVTFKNELPYGSPSGPRRDIRFLEPEDVQLGPAPDGGIDEVIVHPLYSAPNNYDFALIKLSTRADLVVHNLEPIRVQHSGSPAAGDPVTFVGFGKTLTNCSADGGKIKRKGLSWIYALNNHASGALTLQMWDHNVYPCKGDSGGPMLNSAGRVIGVLSTAGPNAHRSDYGATQQIRSWLSNNACTEFDPDVWDWDFCSDPLCPCGWGQGDCDTNSQCAGTLQCIQNNGAKFGAPASRDYCDFAFQLSL